MNPNLSKYLTVTNVLVACCVLVFFFQSQSPSLLTGGELYFSQNPKHDVWQYLSYMFMHGSTNHLLFNMLALWMFGTALERVWGKQRFLFFYLACGIGAAFIYMQIGKYQFDQMLAELSPQLSAVGMSMTESMEMFAAGRYMPSIPLTKEAVAVFATPMVGASGAIYGILVAFAFLFPNHKLMLIFLPYPIAAKYFVPALLGLDLFSGVTGFSLFGGNVAHFAHIGGAIIGAVLTFVWYQRVKQQRQQMNTQLGIWRE